MTPLFPVDPRRRAWLELPDGGVFQLGAQTSIGRQPGNDLTLADDTLSRRHALITQTAAGYELADLRSRNGTVLAGQPLLQPATLRDGDRIRLGAAELRFRCVRSLSPVPTPETGSTHTTQVLAEIERRNGWLAIVALHHAAEADPSPQAIPPVRWLEWIRATRPALEQHAGAVSVYLEDAMLVTWPAVTATPAHVRASLRALDAGREQSPVSFRVVVHHGAVHVSRGPAGDEPGGPDVAFVCSLATRTRELGTGAVFSDAAVRSLGLELSVESRGRFTLEGSSGTHEVFGFPPPVADRGEAAANSGGAGGPSRLAVFLSYASQDAPAVRGLCAALRAAGVEVWLDQSELRGGDAWDETIRRQIKACALFIPAISAHTQARREGYFRLEWKLAAQRTHAMADGTPFLLPVTLDATPEPQAIVPPEFREVQWTQASAPGAAEAFAQRVRRLLDSAG